MKKFFNDFKAFISKGNILDMAVGVIVGGAFSKIVTSLVNDIIMPLLSLAMGGKSLAQLVLPLNEAAKNLPFLENGAANPQALFWHYGNFIQSIIDFLIIALCIFLFIKLFMKLRDTAGKTSGEFVKRMKKHGKAEVEAVETIADTATVAAVEETTAAVQAAEVNASDTAASNDDNNERIIALLTDIRNSLNIEASTKE